MSTAADFDPRTVLAHDSLTALAEAAAATHGPVPAFSTVLPNGASASMTYAALEEAASAFAAWLVHEAGLKPGEVVAIQAPNCLGYPVALLGALKAGAIVSNVNPLYTAHETLRQIDDCGARVLVGFDAFGTALDEVMAARPDLHLVLLSAVDFFPAMKAAALRFALRHIKRMVPALDAAHTPLGAALAAGRSAPPVPPSHRRRTEDTAFYQYSGGTTGASKGVKITMGALMTNLAQALAMSPDVLGRPHPSVMLVLPLYHVFGLFITASALNLGGHVVLVPSPRPLANLKPAFEKYPPTIFPGVNALFAGLMKEDWFADVTLEPLTLTLSGATALTSEVAEAWAARTGSEIIEAYGLTEATTLLTMNPPGSDHRPGMVGAALPGTELRLVDAEGRDVPDGHPGEIWARGPQVMKGYLARPEETAEALADGWLRTGDMAVRGEDGRYTLVDRKKDMIIVSGFNVYPSEVEDVLARCPGVVEAGVIGRPDPATGEQVRAFVVRDREELTAEDVLAFASSYLTAYKRPREVVFVEALPKSPIGKVLRKALRDLAPAATSATGTKAA